MNLFLWCYSQCAAACVFHQRCWEKTVRAKTNRTAQLALVLSIFALLDLSTCHRPTPGSFTGYEYEIDITVNVVIRPTCHRTILLVISQAMSTKFPCGKFYHKTVSAYSSHIFALFHCLCVSLFLTPRERDLNQVKQNRSFRV